MMEISLDIVEKMVEARAESGASDYDWKSKITDIVFSVVRAIYGPVSVEFIKLSPDAVLPEYQHEDDSGMDVCSIDSKIIQPGERVIFGTGLAAQAPSGFELQARSRSGLEFKHGVSVSHGLGTIDSGYRGEIKIILHNKSDKAYSVEKGDRIAQLVLSIVPRACVREVKFFGGDTSRSDGGFGSTGR